MEDISPIKALLKLTRINMSMAIAFSALAGYIYYSHALDWTALILFIGVLFLAVAATVINQYQERHQDALMTRTKDRPLPAGQLKSRTAIIIAIVMLSAGSAMLYFFTTPITALLGIFNVIWYNALYTPLKKITSFAVLIGAVTGAVPPMMGWTAAGGSILSHDIIFITFFMFFWQIPHFCLLLLKFKKDYEAAGFPSITSLFDERNVQFIIFIWILGTAISTLIFPLFHVISGLFLIGCIVVLNIILIIFFFRNTFNRNVAFNLSQAFRSLYLYQVVVLALLIVQALK